MDLGKLLEQIRNEIYKLLPASYESILNNAPQIAKFQSKEHPVWHNAHNKIIHWRAGCHD